MNKFFKRYFAFLGILVILIFLLQQLLPGTFIHNAIWYMLLFFAGISLVTHLFTAWGMKQKSNQLFMTSTYGSMFIKLFASILFIFIYLAFESENRLAFVLNFFALYFFFMAFEIQALLYNLRAPKK